MFGGFHRDRSPAFLMFLLHRRFPVLAPKGFDLLSCGYYNKEKEVARQGEWRDNPRINAEEKQ